MLTVAEIPCNCFGKAAGNWEQFYRKCWGWLCLASVAPAWFANIIFWVKAIVGQQLSLRNIGTTRCSLILGWYCCFGSCICVSVWCTSTDLQSPLPATPAGVATSVSTRWGPTSTLQRASLVQKLLGLIVGLSQLVRNCLIGGWSLWPISSQFPGWEVLSSQCLVLEQG